MFVVVVFVCIMFLFLLFYVDDVDDDDDNIRGAVEWAKGVYIILLFSEETENQPPSHSPPNIHPTTPQLPLLPSPIQSLQRN